MFTSAIGSKEFVIDDSNFQQLAPAQDIYVNGELKTRGHMPRDYAKEPYGSKFAAFDLPLIPRGEWPARIEEMERTGSSLSQLMRRRGIPVLDQNGTNYCWINAPTWCVMVIREKANLPNMRLSPASVGSKIKNFRNVGGWGTEGLEYITEHGVVPQELWPPNAISRQYDTPAAWDVAKGYQVTEWSDLQPRNLDQMATCLLYGIPVAIGLNWWSHEVTAMDLVLLGANDYGIRIANSWGESWSDGGYGILKGSKMLPDDAVAPRVAVAA